MKKIVRDADGEFVAVEYTENDEDKTIIASMMSDLSQQKYLLFHKETIESRNIKQVIVDQKTGELTLVNGGTIKVPAQFLVSAYNFIHRGTQNEPINISASSDQGELCSFISDGRDILVGIYFADVFTFHPVREQN